MGCREYSAVIFPTIICFLEYTADHLYVENVFYVFQLTKTASEATVTKPVLQSNKM